MFDNENHINKISKSLLDTIRNVSEAKKPQLDPVGKEDADIDNDGKANTVADKYLLNRRAVRTAAIQEAKKADKDYDGDGKIESPHAEHNGAVRNAIKLTKGWGDGGKSMKTSYGKVAEEETPKNVKSNMFLDRLQERRDPMMNEPITGGPDTVPLTPERKIFLQQMDAQNKANRDAATRSAAPAPKKPVIKPATPAPKPGMFDRAVNAVKSVFNEEEQGEKVSVIYIDGKPSTKYVKAHEANTDAGRLRIKHPAKTIEVKQEIREDEEVSLTQEEMNHIENVVANEDVQQIDEVSEKMARAYRDKAGEDIEDRKDEIEYMRGMAKMGGYAPDREGIKSELKDINKRKAGIKMASSKLYGGAKVRVKEDVEQVDEALTAKDRFTHHHENAKKLLKSISEHLEHEKKAATNHRNHKGQIGPDWGHVGSMEHLATELGQIHDRLARKGEYAPIAEESEELSEGPRGNSPIAGTKKVSSHQGKDGYRVEVRYNPDWQEYQVHHYQGDKHLGEGPVSYHGEGKEGREDAEATATENVKNNHVVNGKVRTDRQVKEETNSEAREKIEVTPRKRSLARAANDIMARNQSVQKQTID